MNESAVINHAQHGDEAAWETLMYTHQEAVFRLAYLLLGDADEADDVAQETFIRAFQALARFDTERPFRPWLLRITTNLAHNRRRSVKRYVAALQRVLRYTSESCIAPPSVQNMLQYEAQMLWQAVRRLGRIDQEVIYLRYFLELSEGDTARTLGVAPGTVKSRISRALGRLRIVIDREFPSLREERSV